ncbi:hypothetical protein [Yoonia sp. I 8.24]|uniref:hypothetical protein n=1 Tax=Yoonia sp. I 8.24 TaxID=1537229 RepID=UPI001EDE612F|nr:hypothetical protein [Yoonia sp. I 8.24]MCG3266376.1 hypothetical protein [Yoonia sp. I 8.24]
MAELETFASKEEKEKFWNEIFRPYEHGLNAIHAEDLKPSDLESFIDLLQRFKMTSPQEEHVNEVIRLLKIELEIRCPH